MVVVIQVPTRINHLFSSKRPVPVYFNNHLDRKRIPRTVMYAQNHATKYVWIILVKRSTDNRTDIGGYCPRPIRLFTRRLLQPIISEIDDESTPTLHTDNYRYRKPHELMKSHLVVRPFLCDALVFLLLREVDVQPRNRN